MSDKNKENVDREAGRNMKPSPGATPEPGNKGPVRDSVPREPSKDPKHGDKRQQ